MPAELISPTSPSTQCFLDLALQVSRAESSEQFYESLRAGYLTLHGRLTDDAKGREAQALRDAFQEATLPQRLALQLCALPLYEKPFLPGDADAPPEFLWLFTVPVVIRFSQKLADQGTFIWPDDALPCAELLDLLHNGNRLEPRAQLGMFSPLYTRNDLLAWGPENLALHAVNAEVADTPAPAALPVHLSAARPAYRSVMFFALAIARVPIGVRSLIRQQEDKSDLIEMQRLIAQRLTALGVDFESVSVTPPCPVTSSCFMANPAYLDQVESNCSAARKDLGAVTAQVKFPMPGYIEISARTASGQELSLLPPEPCCEPPAVVVNLLENALRHAGLEVASAAFPHVSASPRLQ